MARLTYINLLNGYFILQLPSRLGARASHLFLSLLHEANKLAFPEILHIPNSIAQGISGAGNPSSLFRARERLVDFSHNGETLLSYLPSPNVRKCGSYLINYSLLLDSLPHWFHYENDTPALLTESLIGSTMTTKAESKRSQSGVKAVKYIDKTRQEKNTTTTSLVDSTHCKEVATLEGSSSIFAPRMEKDVNQLKAAIMEKGWPSVSQPPSDNICVLALGKYEFDELVETIARMPLALKYDQDGDETISTILKYAANTSWGIPQEDERESLLCELQQQEELYESSLTRPESDFSGGNGNPKEHFLNQTQEKIDSLKVVINRMGE